MIFLPSVPVLNSLASEPSVFEELFVYFKEKYFTGNIGTYENFSFGTGSLISLRVIVFGLVIGIVIATVLTIIERRYLGNLVRKLISQDCLSNEKAKTLSELGCPGNYLYRSALRGGHVFGRLILQHEEPKPPTEEKAEEAETEEKEEPPKPPRPAKLDFTTARFYIPEEKRYEAEARFERKGSNWLVGALTVIGSLFLIAGLLFIVPELLRFLDNFLTVIKK